MSDHMTHNDEEKYLYAIIRKPQEGKTFICLESIERSPNCIHLVITMNTIKSNLQFFERATQKFGDKICVFNSKSPKKENKHSFNHAKDVINVQKMIKKGVDIIIMCAHYKRFEHSIIDLLNILEDSRSIKKEIA